MKRWFVLLFLVVLMVAPVSVLAQDGEEGVPEGWIEYESEDEMVTFIHPEDWWVLEMGPYYVASNSEAAINTIASGEMYEFQSGEMGVMMYFKLSATYDEIEGLEEMEVADMVRAVVEFEQGDEYTYADEASVYPMEEGKVPDFIGGSLAYSDETEAGIYTVLIPMEDVEMVVLSVIAFAPGELTPEAAEVPARIFESLDWDYSAEDVADLWAEWEGEEEDDSE